MTAATPLYCDLTTDLKAYCPIYFNIEVLYPKFAVLSHSFR